MLALQEQGEPRSLLGQLLVDQKLLTAHELNVVLAKYRREHLLGDILIGTNLVTSAQLDAALARQQRTGAPLGETQIKHFTPGTHLGCPDADVTALETPDAITAFADAT